MIFNDIRDLFCYEILGLFFFIVLLKKSYWHVSLFSTDTTATTLHYYYNGFFFPPFIWPLTFMLKYWVRSSCSSGFRNYAAKSDCYSLYLKFSPIKRCCSCTSNVLLSIRITKHIASISKYIFAVEQRWLQK